MSAEEAGTFRRALLLEDEAALGTAIEIALKQMRLPFVRATTLRQARELAAAGDFDFFLLDRTLPDGDGLALCRELRGRGVRAPVLVLSARGEVHERVEGLNQGADDYLPKPFSWDELHARIQALHRRAQALSPAAGEVVASGWRLDEKRLEVAGPHATRRLTPLEFKLAARLIRSPDEIVSRDVLLKDVWGFTLLPKTRTVDYFLSRLRKNFEANPEEPRHFLTIRGAGYQFKP